MATIRFMVAALAALMVTSAHAATWDSGQWTVIGNAGEGDPEGNAYHFVTTYGGVPDGGVLPQIGGGNGIPTGSSLTTQTFAAAAGEMLELNFFYATSDSVWGGDNRGADYGWARLLDGAGQQVALLYTVRTTPGGSSVPGFDMPPAEAILNPEYAPVHGGGVIWDALGNSSGACAGEGCGLTDWVNVSYMIEAGGIYSLQLGVTNWNDEAYQSAMAFADVKIGGKDITPELAPQPAPIPQPASAVLLVAGIGAFGIVRRRRIRPAIGAREQSFS